MGTRQSWNLVAKDCRIANEEYDAIAGPTPEVPLTSLYVPCKGSSQHVLSLEIIIIVAIFRRDNLE